MEQVVHVRVCDAQTGASLPCRLLIRDTTGQLHVPLGYLSDPSVEEGREVGGHLVQGGDVWTYIDGQCEVRLPPGRLFFQVRRGLRYLPLCTEEDRGLGRIAVRLRMRQAISTEPGWYWADTRAHWLTPAAAALEGAAEDLDLVHVLAARWDRPGLPRISNLLDFSGQQVLLERYGCKVMVNTYQRGGAWGDLALLHCHRIVFPLVSGETGFEHYTLADWCYQCHRKGGLVIWPSFPGEMGERFLLAVLGDIDGIEWCGETLRAQQAQASDPSNQPAKLGPDDCADGISGLQPDTGLTAGGLALWYALLNLGKRLAIVGASGKRSNATPLGAVRTATFLGAEPLTPAAWVAAVKRGQTYATCGPVLRWQINGQQNIWNWPPPAGEHQHGHPERLEDASSQQTAVPLPQKSEPEVLDIQVQARSVSPFMRLELICAGQVMESASASETVVEAVEGSKASVGHAEGDANRPPRIWLAELRWQIRFDKLAELPGNWLALRCWRGDCLVAHSSAIWLPTFGQLSRADRDLLEHALGKSEAIIQNTAHPRRETLLQRLDEARALIHCRGRNR
jgi:hypothetical protein